MPSPLALPPPREFKVVQNNHACLPRRKQPDGPKELEGLAKTLRQQVACRLQPNLLVCVEVFWGQGQEQWEQGSGIASKPARLAKANAWQCG